MLRRSDRALRAMSLITGLNNYRKEPAVKQPAKDRFAGRMSFLSGMKDGGEWPIQLRSRQQISNDSGNVWQVAFHMATPPDESSGPWLTCKEDPINPMAPMSSRARKYVPEPDVEKDIAFRTSRVKMLPMPGQAYPSSVLPLADAAPPTGEGGVARPQRKRPDGRPMSCSAPLTARETLYRLSSSSSRRTPRRPIWPVGSTRTRPCVCPG